MGVDSESKGLWIYWPGKNCVSIERDVYFNEKDIYEPEEVLIEGESDILTNSNIPQPSTSSQPIKNTKINPIEPETATKNVPDNPDTNNPNPPTPPSQNQPDKILLKVSSNSMMQILVEESDNKHPHHAIMPLLLMLRNQLMLRKQGTCLTK